MELKLFRAKYKLHTPLIQKLLQLRIFHSCIAWCKHCYVHNTMQEQEKKDGVTGDGKALGVETENVEGESCTKCGIIEESLLLCSVRINAQNAIMPTYKLYLQSCKIIVYCSQNCQRRDWRSHVLQCSKEIAADEDDWEGYIFLKLHNKGILKTVLWKANIFFNLNLKSLDNKVKQKWRDEK